MAGSVRSVSVSKKYTNKKATRVEIDKDDLREHASNATLIPGMNAEVIFVTEERTLLQYLSSPMMGVLRRGMRER